MKLFLLVKKVLLLEKKLELRGRGATEFPDKKHHFLDYLHNNITITYGKYDKKKLFEKNV